MSLLQNEEFALYQLRTAYLSSIKDGVGERLINVNTSVLNNPAFRAAGWQPNAADIKRTYSPPIPTAIAAEYFRAPKSAGLSRPSLGDDDDEGGMVTGGAGSNDTVGPTLTTKRRRRREQQDEDDSSDLSDESDDEEETARRGVHQIKFSKMPVRTRAGSSPLRSTTALEGPSVMITSPSRPPETDRLRRGSLGAVEAVKARARRDTTTSSEMSSENELDPSVFQRKQISSRRGTAVSQLNTERIQEDEREGDPQTPLLHDPGAESDSSLTSDFSETADSTSLLGDVVHNPSTPLETRLPTIIPPPITPHGVSPKKGRPLPALDALPLARPISMVQPVSALTLALKSKEKKPGNPLEKFASFSGKVEPNPLYIKLWTPFAKGSPKPYEVILRRTNPDGGATIVADAIGFALWRYTEEKREPLLDVEKMSVNRWVLRMVEDDEVEYDFPAVGRTRPIIDFTSNNNRARPRAREKPWDEFALVEANETELEEAKRDTPQYSVSISTTESNEVETPINSSAISLQTPIQTTMPPLPLVPRHNPITGPSFAPTAAPRKGSTTLLDRPAVPISHATPRTGAPKVLTVHFTDNDFLSRAVTIESTTDTYLGEVFDQTCKKLKVDKALYVLKVSGTNTVALSDRTVEALGDRSDLDLARRRFVGDGTFGLSGSPGSSSPNAPLLIAPGGTPKKGKKGTTGMLHPLAQKQDAFVSVNTANYKRFNVTRKQPMSFASSSSRTLALDREYIHIMPNEGAGGTKAALFEAPSKTTTVHFSSIVGSKVSRRHPKMFRVVVYKERETKRYDFEAHSQEEALEIVKEIRKGMEKFQDGFN